MKLLPKSFRVARRLRVDWSDCAWTPRIFIGAVAAHFSGLRRVDRDRETSGHGFSQSPGKLAVHQDQIHGRLSCAPAPHIHRFHID